MGSGGPLEKGWLFPSYPKRWLPDDNSRIFKAAGNFKGVAGLYIRVSTEKITKAAAA